ncbi:MAG: amidohydrolase, partial [Actinomycetota bacterium]
MLKILLVISLILNLLILPNVVFGQTKQKISLLLFNGKVFTADAEFSVAEAVAVDGEKIVAVGASND